MAGSLQWVCRSSALGESEQAGSGEGQREEGGGSLPPPSLRHTTRSPHPPSQPLIPHGSRVRSLSMSSDGKPSQLPGFSGKETEPQRGDGPLKVTQPLEGRAELEPKTRASQLEVPSNLKLHSPSTDLKTTGWACHSCRQGLPRHLH